MASKEERRCVISRWGQLGSVISAGVTLSCGDSTGVTSARVVTTGVALSVWTRQVADPRHARRGLDTEKSKLWS